MCEPISMAVLSFTANTVAQRRMQKQQIEYQEKATRQENERIVKEYRAKTLQERKNRIALAQKLTANQSKAFEAIGTTLTAGIEGGVDGSNALKNALSNIKNKQAKYDESVRTASDFETINTLISLDNTQQQGASNLLAINKPVAEVDYLGNAVSAIGTGFNIAETANNAGFNSYSDFFKNPFKKQATQTADQIVTV